MTHLDPALCREHLAEVLAEEAGLLGELTGCLRRESEMLGTRDALQLEKTVLARQEKMAALARIEEQRRSLCSLHGYSPDYAGLEGLLMWCDPEGTLLSKLRECAQLANECRDLNDRNGALVRAKLKRVEGLLETLTGRPLPPSDTYSPNGSTSGARQSRILGAA